MHYATSYDVGDRKRETGINEDSVALTVFEEGHREGYRGQNRTAEGSDASSRPTVPANRSAVAFALADGAGGHDAGDVASYIASTVVCEELAGTAVRAARRNPDPFDVSLGDYPEQPSDDDLEVAVGEAIVTAHREILDWVASSGTQAYTTVVAGLAVGGSVHVGWVGDSRLYVVNRTRGTIGRLTDDHAVVERLREQGDLDEVEAHVHPRGNEITRALGGSGDVDPDGATVEVDTRTVPLYAEDVVLATSDGLVDAQIDARALYKEYVESGGDEEIGAEVLDRVVTDEELRDVVLTADSLEGAATQFVELANERGGKDNVSTLLFRDDTLEPTPESADLADRVGTGDGPIQDRQTVVETED